MSDPARPGAAEAAEEAERRRRREAVFGAGLPEQTRDDLDDAAGSGSGTPSGDGAPSAQDRWLQAQVPPHHGS